ncbi:Mov34/MPN/PAD-1 family protein [Methylosinus sp. RM1]|uniref:Mov34/MPN/PAD-1 family protein n=1 Tax=Methylosinus sp. RM1 TaxID=2583817 RepID=UPI001FEEDB65|nr:Mov34/MPN/PAD-1 family protein [Methylosinus sp. RM1]
MRYKIGISGQSLSFASSVLEHFIRHRQTRFWRAEAGGLLFAKVSPEVIDVVTATGPRSTDGRSRWRYSPDREAEQREIDLFHAQGQHLVGFWHTHPEMFPSPSKMDSDSITESFRMSKHQLNGFVQVIVGQHQFPPGLYVGVGDGSQVYRLSLDHECRIPTVSPGRPELP